MQRSRTSILSFVTAFLVMLSGFFASAAHASDTLLTVYRDVNGLSVVTEFTREDLEGLPQVSLVTENEFVDGPTKFVGPLARDILNTVGRGISDTLILTAANDFQVEIPVAEIDKYDVVFALQANDIPLSPRTKGPIWVMYPISQHDELQDPIFNSRLIWQLVRMDVR